MAKHIEGLGMTGWDFGQLRSRRLGFDFDSILGHATGVGVSDADLEAVRAAALVIPWLEIRKSTGGGGLHLYALCCADGIPTANHTEHAALGRAILEMMSAATGFNFSTKVDACGGNMWIWHRKSSLANEGLKLLKPATATLSEADIPGDWRSHIAVIQKKRTTQRVVGIPANADDSFDELVAARPRVPLTDEHRRIMDALAGNDFSMIYQQDNHLVQVHTARLAQLIADPRLEIRGIFKTISEGTDPGTPNAFMFPLSNGGWRVYRFSPGTKEANTWKQGEGWTSCDFNVRATLVIAAEAEGGQELLDGCFVFGTPAQGIAALRGMGGSASVPDWAADRQLILKPHPSARKVSILLEYRADDDNPRSKKDMLDLRWNLDGKQAHTKRWSQVVHLPSTDNADIAAEMLERCDTRIRSVKTPDNQDAGWRIADDDRAWVERDRTAARDALASIGLPSSEFNGVIARLQSRNWTLSNIPFQPEFPGGRRWNIGAQLAYTPTDDERPMVHPHWDAIFAHVGQGLDEAVERDEWCQGNGVSAGALYLLHWAASLFQRPSQKLPYLFFFGDQETGKSSFNNAIGSLMSRGHIEARNSLLTKHNGELDGAILAYVEEVDLSGKASDAYNRLKDWVTGDRISIHAKYATVYSSPSHLHWIQVANNRQFCPIFEGDTRIVVIEVPAKPSTDIPWPTLKAKLQAEAPDFLRTLLDLRLPDGVGRLWLPVLDTQAKREAIIETTDKGGAFDPVKLENALRLLLLKEGNGVCKALVSELLALLGDGPWSNDENVFGRQLKLALKDCGERGLTAKFTRLAGGTQWNLKESGQDSDIDVMPEWAQLSALADYASRVLRALPPPIPLSLCDTPVGVPLNS
ncbi:MAG TPA: primase-helicase family protein [Pirellulales bacterium]